MLGVNAMRVFDELGLAQAVAARGFPLHRIGVRTAAGRTLSFVDIDQVARRTGLHSVAISRAALHQVLSESLPPPTIRLGETCVAVTADADGVSAGFASGREIRPDILVGADGLHSHVRQALGLDAPLRDPGQVCFRGLCSTAGLTLDDDGFYESWGQGRRFGFVEVGEGQLYWFLTLNRGQVPIPEGSGSRDELVDQFRDWWRPIPDVIAATHPDAIIRNDLFDRPPADLWHRHGAVLLGDAAHPTTPNMGQGAGMAVESAAVLAHCLATVPHVEDALAEYERLRRPRTASITRRSWHLGRLATLSGSVAIGLRNVLLGSVPQRLGQRQAEALFTYDIYGGAPS